MYYSGFTVRMNRNGRIPLPKEVRQQIGIEPKSEVLMQLEKDKIMLTKKQIRCLVTGTTEDIIEVLPGIMLSREGMEFLLKELNF